MSIVPKRWQVAPFAPRDWLESLPEYGWIMAQVLFNRGIDTPEKAELFLEGTTELHDPNLFKMAGMNDAVQRILTAVKKREPVVVYGDFDADGVTSTALLVQTLRAVGANVRPYIPHRVDEGYGLNTPALRELAKQGVKLVITVDCGIRSVEEVKEGTAAGLDIIVTDHHSIGEELPKAQAVINPKRVGCPYPEKMLAGVGIAFKLSSALLKAARQNTRIIADLDESSLLDLVALGTVADLAPLDRLENRKLVQLGLQELAKAKRPGIFALMEVSGLQPDKVNAWSIGFALGPRINAAGRLENAMIAYELLNTDDIQVARELAQKLQEINERRQELTRDAYEFARASIDKSGPLIFIQHESFQPGIVGLVAGRLVEEYYRPAVVIQVGKKEAHGSCRSIPEFNVTQALDRCADLLIRHGGHAQAAGFAIVNENLPVLQKRLTKLAETELAHVDLRPALAVDAEVNLPDLTMFLAENLRRLEPTGVDNPQPVFAARRLRVISSRTVGKEGDHLKLRLKEGMTEMDAIGFRLGYWYNRLPLLVDVAFRLEINEWNGRSDLQLNLLDLAPSEA